MLSHGKVLKSQIKYCEKDNKCTVSSQYTPVSSFFELFAWLGWLRQTLGYTLHEPGKHRNRTRKHTHKFFLNYLENLFSNAQLTR